MTFDAAIAAMIDTMSATFGGPVTYTPVGGTAKTITAIITYGDPDESGLSGMDAMNTEATMEIKTDATNGIAQVSVNDVVTIGSDTWRVLYARKIDDGLTWICRISRSTR